MPEDPINKNLRRAGEYFINSLWIQNQMVDLIILSNHPRIISSFVNNPTRVPYIMTKERLKYWQLDFHPIKQEFISIFGGLLNNSEKDDIEFVYAIRNAISHSSVSLGRDYLMYRPSGNRLRIRNIRSIFSSPQRSEASVPRVFKLDFKNDALYTRNSNVLKRLDEVTFERIAISLNIPHSRIR